MRIYLFSEQLSEPVQAMDRFAELIRRNHTITLLAEGALSHVCPSFEICIRLHEWFYSERIYLSYAHVFGASENQNRNEAHVEYRLTRRWMVETIFGDAGVGGVNALWSYKY